MSQEKETNNLPISSTPDDNQAIELRNEKFRTYMVQLPVSQFELYREHIKTRLNWTRAVWHNKMHGKTRISTAETIVIETIINQSIF